MIERLTLLSALVLWAGSCVPPAMASSGADGAGGATTSRVSAAEKGAAQGDRSPTARDRADDKTLAEGVKPASSCDPAELALLGALRTRQKQLDERERKVVEHEAVLGRIEAELSGRLQAAVAEVRRIEEQAVVKTGGPCPKEPAVKEPPRGNEAITSALATLTPRKAAAILAAADGAVASQLLEELGADKSAAILATMEPTAAAALVQRMTRRPAEPEPPQPAPARRGRGKEGR